MGERFAVGELAAVQQPEGCSPHPRALAVVDRLLGQAKGAADTPANLHDHERRGRTRVDRHEVKLMTTDVDVPGQHGPAGGRQMVRDQLFGRVTRALCCGPLGIVRWFGHGCIVTGRAYQPRITMVGRTSRHAADAQGHSRVDELAEDEGPEGRADGEQ